MKNNEHKSLYSQRPAHPDEYTQIRAHTHIQIFTCNEISTDTERNTTQISQSRRQMIRFYRWENQNVC